MHLNLSYECCRLDCQFKLNIFENNSEIEIRKNKNFKNICNF